MTKDEALKLALEALENAVRYHGIMLMSDPPQAAWKYHRVEDNAKQAITAIKEALAQPVQPVQEPVARVAEVHMSRYTLEWTNGPLPEGTELFSALPVQPEQEPVAWAHKEGLESIKDFDASIYANGGFDDAVPLYTAPPQREWVGLTDDEMHQCFDVSGHREPIYRAICDKLKEKNT